MTIQLKHGKMIVPEPDPADWRVTITDEHGGAISINIRELIRAGDICKMFVNGLERGLAFKW